MQYEGYLKQKNLFNICLFQNYLNHSLCEKCDLIYINLTTSPTATSNRHQLNNQNIISSIIKQKCLYLITYGVGTHYF